jgi:hypothetical protein
MAGSPYVRIDAPMTWNRRPVHQAMIATKASRPRIGVAASITTFRRRRLDTNSIDIRRYACNGR